MADDARSMGREGYVVTMQKPSWIPFVTYSTRRDLREKVIKGYVMRSDRNNDADNKAIIDKIVNLRTEKAHILGFDTWAAYMLDENMAKTPEKAYELMYQVWTPALKRAKEELADIQSMIDREGGDFKPKHGTGGTIPKRYAEKNSTFRKNRPNPTSRSTTPPKAFSPYARNCTA